MSRHHDHENEDNSALLNSIFLGEVASVQNYGAFVKIPGSRNQGLIHRTQISNSPVEDASDILQRGEKVWCKVISITEDNKIALSMKVVDQGHGRDLDPAGVQIHQDEQRRKSYDPKGRRKAIELGAVLNTVCSKCGTHGHLKKDCFKGPDGKTYELIMEDDFPTAPTSLPVQPPVETPTEKPNKHKDKKKKKKHKKEKSKKSSKHKKKKKKKRQSSSSESSSSDESSESSDDEPRRRSSTKEGSRKRKHSRSTSRHRDKPKR